MKIVLLEPLGIRGGKLKQFTEKLQQAGHEFVAYPDRIEDDDILIERAMGADVLMITNLPLSGKVIKACPQLKMISVAFTGIDHIDMEACRKNDVMVCNASGYANQAVAELVFGMIITLKRSIISCNKAVREGKTRQGLIGQELLGSRMGIVGTGAIGTKVAEIARTFGCKLYGYDIDQNEQALQMGLEYIPLEQLMQESDIITLHVPLLDATRHLIDHSMIDLMKPSAILINAARGPVIDNQALAHALNQGKIAGAGIDVFEMEPPIPEDHPLLQANNTVLTPHVAFATEQSFIKRARIVFNNIHDWLDGYPKNVML